MDELQLVKAIENSVKINEREAAAKINIHALAASYARGGKKAKQQIDKINKKIDREVKGRQAKAAMINATPEETITEAEIIKIMGPRDGK